MYELLSDAEEIGQEQIVCWELKDTITQDVSSSKTFGSVDAKHAGFWRDDGHVKRYTRLVSFAGHVTEYVRLPGHEMLCTPVV